MYPFVAGGTNIEPKQRKPVEAFTERLTNPSKDLMVKFINDENFAKTMVKLDSERMMKYYEIQDIIRLNHMHLVGKPLEQIQKLNEERNDLLNEMIKYDTEKSSTEEARQLIALQYTNIQQEENFYIDRFLRNYNTEVKMPIQFGEDSTYNNAVRQIRFEDAKKDADRKIDFDLKSQYLPKLQMYANEVPAYKNRIMSEYLQWRQAKEEVKQELYENSMKGKAKLSAYEIQELLRTRKINLLADDLKFREGESYDWEAEAEIKQLKEMDDKILKDEPNVDRATLLEDRRKLNKRIEEIKSKAKAEDIKELKRLLDTVLKSEPTTKTKVLRDAEEDARVAERKAAFEERQYQESGGAERDAAAAAAEAKAADKARRKAIQTALDNKRAAEAAAKAAADAEARSIKEATTPVTGGSFVNKAGQVVMVKFAPAGGAAPAAPAAPAAGKLSLTSLRSKNDRVSAVGLLNKFA
jgi:hypothetical protein